MFFLPRRTVDLLKRYSGIVLGPGAVPGIAPRWEREDWGVYWLRPRAWFVTKEQKRLL